MTIIRRSGSYGVRVRHRWVGTFPTLREARAAERNAYGRPLVARNETCDAFAERWPEDYPRPSKTTQRTYRYALVAFREQFEGVRLAELDRPTARAWALGQPRKNVEAIRAMFSDAMRDGLVAHNPFSNLRMPTSRGRRDIDPLTEAELADLAEVARKVHGDYGSIFSAMITFAGYVGLRPGELFALRHEDIGVEDVRIRRSLSGVGEITAPKNGRERSVILPPLARQAVESMPRRIDVPEVFSTKRARRFSKSQFAIYWHPVRAAFGQPRLHFYELRHSCATMLLERGLSASDVAWQLGHTDGGALVTSTYGHPERSARERLLAAFAGPTPLTVARDARHGAGGQS